MPPPVLVCGEWEEERVRDMWVCERDAFRSYTFCPRFSPQVEGSLQCWRVCVCVCVRVFVWSLQYYVFLFPEEFFRRKKKCRVAFLVELDVLLACDWQNENITFLVINILKLATLWCLVRKLTYADVCWRMLTYAWEKAMMPLPQI